MTPSDLAVRTSAAAPVPVVSVSGRLHLPDVPLLMAALAGVLGAPPRVAVCDVSGLGVPGPDAWLMAFPAVLRRVGGWPTASLHLAGARPDLDLALRRLRIHRYLPMHPGVVEACRAAEAEIVMGVRELVLAPRPASLRAARTAVRDVWGRRPVTGSSDGIDVALLVATELASNAVAHVGESFRLSLVRASSSLVIAVTDGSRDEPVLRPPRATAVKGRGLQVIDGLSSRWGVRLVHPGGKTVWAAVPTPRSGD